MKKIEEWKINYIRENVGKKTRKEIANELDISMGTLQDYIKKNNWHTKKSLFSDEDILYMKEHYMDMPYKEIASYLGVSERQVRGKINNMGLSKERKIKNDYFHIIDTPLKAYFLGFIYADGYIIFNESTRTYELGIEIQACDKYILEKLNEELGGQNTIYHKKGKEKYINGNYCCSKDAVVLRVYSKKIVLDLISHGIECKKTEKDICPHIDDKYFFDWLRGYIDGDGCYYLSNNNKLYMHITCASKIVLEYVKDRLENFDIKTSIYTEKERKHRLMCFKKSEIDKLINYLYPLKDNFCLIRKYNKIIKYKNGSAA